VTSADIDAASIAWSWPAPLVSATLTESDRPASPGPDVSRSLRLLRGKDPRYRDSSSSTCVRLNQPQRKRARPAVAESGPQSCGRQTGRMATSRGTN